MTTPEPTNSETMLTPSPPGSFDQFLRVLFGINPDLFDALNRTAANASYFDMLEDETPVPAVVACPACGEGHIDYDEWAMPEKAHKTHLCLSCGHLWRPFPFATVGVLAAVGDIVPWQQVPTHSLVMETGENGWRAYTVRLANRGWGVQHGRLNDWQSSWDSIEDGKSPQSPWGTPWISDSTCCEDPETVLIVALGLRGDETDEELRELAHKGPKL